MCTSKFCKEIGYFLYALSKDIFKNAFRGQGRLEQMTLLVVSQAMIYPLLLPADDSWINVFATTAMVLTAAIALSGWILLVALYRHSVRVIFNRRLPTMTNNNDAALLLLPSFSAHLALLRPLEIVFRYLTVRFRVLPDILVLGEVRCGTTTLCHHLASTAGCHPPFCLWRHPELDKKETFYFVGHYLGMVSPENYRMCFPLALTKWFHQNSIYPRDNFFTFDGCAQYLTSPMAPYLIARAYKDAGQPPPILVACVRNPVDQALSWWSYENNAMQWGHSMGLTQWNTQLRTTAYPPPTISNALEFSRSDKVQQHYDDAEDLMRTTSSSSSSSSKLCNLNYYAPDWAITWPAGQLSGIGRNGCFAENIRRYERVFSETFGRDSSSIVGISSSSTTTTPLKSSLKFVTILPLDVLKRSDLLGPALNRLLDGISKRAGCTNSTTIALSQQQQHHLLGIRRNVGQKMISNNTALIPTAEEKSMLQQFFADDTRELENMMLLGGHTTTLGWSSSSSSSK